MSVAGSRDQSLPCRAAVEFSARAGLVKQLVAASALLGWCVARREYVSLTSRIFLHSHSLVQPSADSDRLSVVASESSQSVTPLLSTTERTRGSAPPVVPAALRTASVSLGL